MLYLGFLLPSKKGLALLAGIGILLYCIYRLGFPKPLKGIPYNPEAANRFWGDMELFPSSNATSPRIRFGTFGEKLNSPLVQIFIRPYGRPALILYDYWEAYNINNRRTAEFDKTERNKKIFSRVVPKNHTALRASDPEYSASKDLIKGVMVPSFIKEVNAPEMYKKALSVLELWRIKSKMAQGRPFSAASDLRDYAFDAILAASFGQSETSIVDSQIRHVASSALQVPESIDAPVEFSRATLSEEYAAVSKVSDSLAIAIRSVFPKHEMWFRQTFTKLGVYYRTKDRFLNRKVQESAKRMMSGSEEKRRLRCALDHMILREIEAAAKQGRKPDLDASRIKDELLGYIIAGHDSSTSAIEWLFKYLTGDQRVQHALRQHLRHVHEVPCAENRSPTVAEITSCHAPYLDAVIQEAFRCAYVTPLSLREATRDTQILGHFVPKGTIVWFSNTGPSFTRPEIDFGKTPRTESALEDRKRVPSWDPKDIGAFLPERWLRAKPEAGKVGSAMDVSDYTYRDFEYNPSAGPMTAFGSGPRGCCGKRLVYLSMRVLFTIILLEFELKPCPSELTSDESIHATASHPKQCFVRLEKAV